MSNLLSTAKQVLIEGANELFEINRADIELTEAEYKRHYSNLGAVLFSIDRVNTLSELIYKIEKGDFEELGYCSEDEDMLSEFLKVVNESR